MGRQFTKAIVDDIQSSLNGSLMDGVLEVDGVAFSLEQGI